METEELLVELIDKTYKKELIWCSVISAAIGAFIAVVCTVLIATFLPARSYFNLSVSSGNGTAIMGDSNGSIYNDVTCEIPPELLDYLAEKLADNLKSTE